jgi:hypothetical protein
MHEVVDPVARPAPRRGRVTPAFLGLLAVLVVALAVAGAAASRWGTGCTFAGDRCLRVLFIGNSYTSVNDLPGTFARLAASGGHAVETQMVAPGGAYLSDEVASPDVAAALAGTRWAAVVLQEQSQRPASAQADTQMIPAVVRLVATIRADGAIPYLLETWAHRDGWPENGQDYARMQAAIDGAYARAAERSGSFIVPAGEAWQRALTAAPNVVLWQDDGSHPTAAGTYLAACVLYRTMTHQSPVGLSDTGGLDAATAAQLQQVAAGG